MLLTWAEGSKNESHASHQSKRIEITSASEANHETFSDFSAEIEQNWADNIDRDEIKNEGI